MVKNGSGLNVRARADKVRVQETITVDSGLRTGGKEVMIPKRRIAYRYPKVGK